MDALAHQQCADQGARTGRPFLCSMSVHACSQRHKVSHAKMSHQTPLPSPFTLQSVCHTLKQSAFIHDLESFSFPYLDVASPVLIHRFTYKP